ncbi:MAG TPA: lasso peptide biosynthesis B2 protein [Candidatus Dormibacteraeota bacterium]|nr:lasso peptide biosynthesis B2 protein [Candidatus Dormibacteraeota bacterium]
MLFFRALLMLIAYDLLCTFSTFGKIHKMVKRWTVARRPLDDDTIDRVCTAVNYACTWYPKQVLCLQCAFVTTYLLRKKGVLAHMVLGAQKLPFKAHAWVEVAGRAINERSNVQATYAVWDRC